MLLFAVLTSNCGAQAPANDSCANAIDLTVDAACVSGTTVNSTPDGPTPSCNTASTGNVWYKFTATSIQSKVEITNVSGFDVVLAHLTTCGVSGNNCSNLNSTNSGESQTFTTVIGNTYLINVKQYGSPAGTFCISVSNLTPPANDSCVNAIDLTVDAACVSGTTVNSTPDGPTPSCNTASTGNVWYKFTATSIQSKVEITNVSGFDVVLAHLTTCGVSGNNCSNLNSTNSGETQTFTTVIGSTYLINVKQFDGTAGTFCISVSNLTPPANDSCVNSINLTVGTACVPGTTVNSTPDGPTPWCNTSTTDNVWYKFTATSVQSKVEVINVSGFDVVLSQLNTCGVTNNSCMNTNSLNGSESIIFSTTIGTTYLVNVKQFDASAGTFCIAVTDAQTTSIETIEDNVVIYPNPANEKVTIKSKKYNGPTNAVITNTLGQVVKSINIDKDVVTMSLEDLKAGFYFLQIPEWNVSKILMKTR
jgi:hypothetical protein